jgi:leucyl-tRNA synthetase
VPWDPKITEQWLPVDLYTGGAEHSVLHLLYVRFISLALHDAKLLSFGESNAPLGEPFPKFRAHGLLIKDGAKMSKSKGNVINPDEYVERFGADALRLYLMFLAPFEQGGDFRDAGMLGAVRFIERVWKYSQMIKKEGDTTDETLKLQIHIHKTIKKVSDDIESLHYNTAVSALMILLNEFERHTFIPQSYFEIFLKLLAPFAPHITEELWHELGNSDSIHRAPWPTYDPALLIEETVTYAVQVNGKVRGTVTAPAEASEDDVATLAKVHEKIAPFLHEKTIQKTIFVPKKIINFIAS